MTALQTISDPLDNILVVKKHLRHVLDVCKLDDNLDCAAEAGVIPTVVSLLQDLHLGDPAKAQEQPTISGVEELERDICFILGLMAIKADYQQAICDANALPTLVAIIKRYSGRKDQHLSGSSAQTCRRAADAITNLAHENNPIKTRTRHEGGIPPLVYLLRTFDPKVQRAVAGTLRTLAFKNDENKDMIVNEGALPLLIQMLYARDPSIHYEAVGVIGNLVHSSQHIKQKVLAEGALQAVINLLSSTCPDSKREAALLLGQFATAQTNDDRADFKAKIVQRGAIMPLVNMLSASDPQLQEMAAFALGRLAQHPDNQAGIMAMGALPKLLDLLRSSQHNLQHNAAFALYGLSENEDNLLHFVVGGSFQTIHAAELGPQASRDCIQKMTKRLQEKLGGKILGQVLYLMQTPTSDGESTRRSVATALGMLCTNEVPSPQDMCLSMIERGALGVIVDACCEPELAESAHKEAALAFHTVATAVGTADPIKVIAAPIAPAEPGGVKLSSNYINNKLLSDVTFIVEGREYYAHRIALLASSEIFRSMFDGNGNFREAQGGSIPIPNIRWEAFHAMMTCIYTGTVDVLPEMAQELLAAADQYMLDTLKRLCEAAIAEQLTAENVWSAYELAENFNAPELAKHCALFCLKNYEEAADAHYEALRSDPDGKFDNFVMPGSAGCRQIGFAHLMKKMGGQLKEAVEADMVKRTQSTVPEDEQMMVFD